MMLCSTRSVWVWKLTRLSGLWNEGGETIGDMFEFNYSDTPIKITTMILWQASVDISSLDHQMGSLV